MPLEFESDTGEYRTPIPATGCEPPVPFSSLVRADIAALSHAGKVRPNNEDHYLVARTGRSLEVLRTNLPEGDLPVRAEETGYGVVVADGMGGEEGGEVASRMAIRTLFNLVCHTPDWILRFDDERSEETLRRASDHYRKIDVAISELAEGDPKLSRMGTTMTLAYSVGAELLVVNAGDSRAYLFRSGQLRQLTRDHTVAQKLVERGEITKEEAAATRLRHVLTSALGRTGGDVGVDVQRLTLADGDCLLLCTDGLTDMVADEQIAEELGRSRTSDETCQSLVERALERGGKDNVTVVVARYRFPAANAGG
jgi:PPM family protein phosphatase